MNQRVQEMGNTLAKMHALVKQMRTKTAGGGNDPVAKANVDLWELMVGQLDQQFEQLRAAARTRQDMESRRNAMYKQAEERAAAAARNAQQAASGATTSQSSVPVAASQQPASSTAAQTTPASSTPSTSPN
jgi:hypothetical protein